MILKLGIPKGSLEGATIELFRRAGFNITTSSRSYFPVIDDSEIECVLIRPRRWRARENGLLDAASRLDWVQENEATVSRWSTWSTQAEFGKCAGVGPRAGGIAFPHVRVWREDHRHGTGGYDQALSGRERCQGQVEFSWGANRVNSS
jgi:ATP phosphoribosyltransferase